MPTLSTAQQGEGRRGGEVADDCVSGDRPLQHRRPCLSWRQRAPSRYLAACSQVAPWRWVGRWRLVWMCVAIALSVAWVWLSR